MKTKYPDEWSLCTLAQVFPRIIVGYVGSVSDFYCDSDSGVPFYRTLNIKDGRFSHKDIEYVTEEFHRKNLKSRIENEDILIARVGANLGMVCKVVGLNSESNIANAIIVKSEPTACSDFFMEFLRSRFGQIQILAGAAGGAQGVFNTRLAQKLSVPFPPLCEQRRIAQILGTWDRSLEAVEALIKNNELSKRAFMDQFFNGKIPVHGSVSTFTSARLRDACSIDSKTLPTSTADDFSFEYISLSDVERGNISEPLQKHNFSTAPSRARKLVDTGDILMSTVRPNLQAFAKVSSRFSECVASTGFAVLKPRDGFSGDYLYHYLYSDHCSVQINAMVVGSNYPALNSSDVANLAIRIPPFEHQLEIAETLNRYDEIIANLKKQHALLLTEKRALAEDLLSGIRRVAAITAR